MKNIHIHQQAIVETQSIGEGSRIWAFVHILPGAKIGKNANICDHCFIENKVVIGNNVTIKSGVYLWDDITIEDDVMIGPAAVFTNDRYPRSRNKNWVRDKVLLKKGCTIGANATILPKIIIGQYALVGAGAVVTKDVPDFALVYGNPAEIRGYVCVCTKKLIFENNIAKCQCGRKYKMKNEKVSL
jgi:acetyltransferase-like isoleucine patch superfamily enzyme